MPNLLPHRLLAGAAVAASLLAPVLAARPAHAWWVRGGLYVPPVVVAPAPVVVLPPPVVVAPPPRVAYVTPPPPVGRWVPGHYNWRGFWVPGHWI